MKGQIKAGKGALIGNAGEYYVVAELLKRGVIATLTPRNTAAFDVLATKGDKTVRIRVKTKSEAYDPWQWAIKKDGTIFRDMSATGDFTVLVNLTEKTRDLEFYILRTKELNDFLEKDFQVWVNTPGKGGRPHDPTNKKRHLLYTERAEQLEPYKNNWDGLWE
ncbi:hypothetical protein ACFLZR_01265 [Candidatus Neomarinimicrobiota bacterium]